MIDRVNLNRLIGQALELDKKVKKKDVSKAEATQKGSDVVEISERARKALEMDQEDITEKVRRIKDEIARGTYEVNADKIIEGFKKFFP